LIKTANPLKQMKLVGSTLPIKKIEVITKSPEESRRLGALIGRLAQPGDVLLLTGNLGAGKTCLTQGVAHGLGIKDYVMSPSFVILRELKGRLCLYHIDLYRLDNIAETADLGLDDYLYGDGIVAVEWADKALSLMPLEHLKIKIDYLSENERRFVFQANGNRYLKMIDDIKREKDAAVH